MDVNQLLNLAGIQFQDRGFPTLETRLNDIERVLVTKLDDAHPRIVNRIISIEKSALYDALQPIGALERSSWLITHHANGDRQDISLLQEMIDLLLEAWVIAFALSRHGGHRGLHPQSLEAEAGTQDWLVRLCSRSMNFCWVNFTISYAMVRIIESDPIWITQCANINLVEINGLLSWSARCLSPDPQPLSSGEPGYDLGLEIAEFAPTATTALHKLLQERSLESSPIRATNEGLLLATPRSFPTHLYVALLELVDRKWKVVEHKKKMRSRDKGTLFERAMQLILLDFLGPSTGGSEPFEIVLSSDKKTDIDCCWAGDSFLIIAECKSHAPTSFADDAHTKLSAEQEAVLRQLHDRGAAIVDKKPIRTPDGNFVLGDNARVIRLGIVTDPAHNLSSHRDTHGFSHLFTVDGIVAALALAASVSNFDEYLTFRSAALQRRSIGDECDLLIAYIQQTEPAPHRLRSLRDVYLCAPRSAAEWRNYLATVPTKIPGVSY